MSKVFEDWARILLAYEYLFDDSVDCNIYQNANMFMCFNV